MGNKTYLAFTLDHDPEEAKRIFESRFGRAPAEVKAEILSQNWRGKPWGRLIVGPVVAQESEKTA